MNADTKTHFQHLIGKYAHVNGKPMNIDPISIRLKEGVNMEWLRQRPKRKNNPEIVESMIKDYMDRNFFVKDILLVLHHVF